MQLRRNHNSDLAAAIAATAALLSPGGFPHQAVFAQPEGVLGYEAINFGKISNGGAFAGRVLDEFARVHGEAKPDGQFASVPVTWINGEFSLNPLPPETPHIGIDTGISPTTGIVTRTVWNFSSPYRGIVFSIESANYKLLPLMPGLENCSTDAVNDSGWIAGDCFTLSVNRPALWIRGREPIDIGDLGGGRAYAKDVNDRGWILGSSLRPGGRDYWPVIWKPDGEIVDLLENIDGEPWFNISGARSFNNHGEVIGSGWYLSEGRLFQTWRVADGCGCDWEAINDRSLFVGMCNPDPGCAVRFRRAYVTEILPDGELRRHNINDFLHHQADVTLLDADDINNAGQIAAFGELPGGEERGFLVTPYQFELSEPAPGVAGERNTITVTNLEPNQRVILAFGTKEGAQPIGNGCLGGLVLIRDASTHKSLEAFADQSGNATFNVLVPKSTAGKTVRYQAVAPDECEISHTVEYTF